MACGFYLKERGISTDNSNLIGFGKSAILQGAFLLAFDGVMYGFHQTHSKELQAIMQNVSLCQTGFSVVISLN